jgi:hypothetical protein
VLGERKGPYGYVILSASEQEKAKIINDGKELMKRLADYKAYFRIENEHH